jgi:hypothetical protein
MNYRNMLVFVPDKLFQSSVIFVEPTLERSFIWVGSGFTQKTFNYVRNACQGQTL